MAQRRIASSFAFVALGGCAAQTVLVGDARSFVSASQVAGDHAAAFFAAARRRQLDANVLLVASDPSCQWGSYIYLRTDTSGGGGLCVTGSEAARTGFRYSLRPIPAEAGAPAFELIAALGAYVGELSRLDASYVPEFREAVDGVEARLSKVQTVLAGAGRLDPEGLGAAATALKAAGSRYSAPAEAVAGLLDFFGGLARTASDAKAVRAYVASHGGEFESAVEALGVVMEAWDAGIVATSAQVARDSLIVGTNRALAGTADFDRRRALLGQLVQGLQDEAGADAGYDAAAKLLSDLKAQHAALRAFAAGSYSPADRARIAGEQERQAWDFLGRVGTLASATAGAVL